MARAAWQGYVTLGRLAVPVRLYQAVRSRNPRFVQLHETDGSPVERELRCRAEGRPIDSSEVVRAVEYAPGQYITLTDRELAVSESDLMKRITVRQFCPSDAIAPIYFERPFYIVPGKGGERAYALLREVLTRLHTVAVAEFVIYRHEHLAMVGVQGDLLLLQQLRFAADILPRSSLSTPPLPKPSPVEIEALSAVVQTLNGPFYIEDYHDVYTERLQAAVERKAKGLPPPRRERPAPQATPENQLVEALQHTLQESPRPTLQAARDNGIDG